MSTSSFATATNGDQPNGEQHAESGRAVIVEWPAQRDVLAELEESGTPRLVVVDDGCEPPFSVDCGQDWTWRSAGGRELRLRLQQLSLRALHHGHLRPHLDPLGMLHLGLRSVHLPGKQQALAAALLAQLGRCVPRDELIRAVWPDGISRPNVLASRLSALRPRLRWLGLDIQGSAAAGYCLSAIASGPDGAAGGFEDELSSAGPDGRGSV